MSRRTKAVPVPPTPATTTTTRKRDHGRYAVADERKARALSEGHAAAYYWPSNVKKRAAYEAKKARNRELHALYGRPEVVIQYLADLRSIRLARRVDEE